MTFEDFFNKPNKVDPTKKRGPHHLKLGRGLNTDRKDLGIVAKMHQLDPEEHPLVRRLKSQTRGREFIHNPSDAQKVASKYGINLSAIQRGESKTLGNKTGITMSYDTTSGKYVLTK